MSTMGRSSMSSFGGRLMLPSPGSDSSRHGSGTLQEAAAAANRDAASERLMIASAGEDPHELLDSIRDAKFAGLTKVAIDRAMLLLQKMNSSGIALPLLCFKRI